MKYLLTAVLAAALTITAGAQESSQWFLGSDFDFYFDNLEASGSEIDCSGTMFFARLSPYAGLEFDGRHRLTAGLDVRQDFGDSVSFVSEAHPFFYYSYKGERWTAHAGIFPRRHLRGTYSEAIMSGGYQMDRNMVYGLSSTYNGQRGFWEAAISWDGMYSDRCRERFHIFSTAQYDWHAHWHAGYNFKLTHFAKSDRDIPSEGVVDNIRLDPFVGCTFNGWGDWTLRAHAIVGYQNDRIAADRRIPAGGQLDVAVEKWGFRLHNELYLGDNQLPFYRKYGTDLYYANENYGTSRHVYNHSGLDYNRTLLDGLLCLGANFEAHYDGTSVALQQVVTVTLNFEKMFKIK